MQVMALGNVRASEAGGTCVYEAVYYLNVLASSVFL